MKYLGRNTLSMLAIAAFTMIATLAVITPKGADAEDGDDTKTAETIVKITPTISMPKLEEDNCTATLKMDKEGYEQGDKPVLTVDVVNNSKEAIEKSITVSMTSRSLISGGRMPSIARVVWTKTTVVSLAAGESKTLTLTADVGVDADSATAFAMSGDKETVEKTANLRRIIEEIELPEPRKSAKQVRN